MSTDKPEINLASQKHKPQETAGPVLCALCGRTSTFGYHQKPDGKTYRKASPMRKASNGALVHDACLKGYESKLAFFARTKVTTKPMDLGYNND